MKKILLTIIGLAMASPAWSAQTAVTEISGVQPSVGALKTQVNTKLGTIESNRLDHETRVAAMETGKETKAVIQASAPANTSIDWYDTDQEVGVYVHKKHNGTTWVRVGSHGVQYLSSCASIAAGMCVDTDDGKLYYHNNTGIVEVGSGGSVDLSAYLSKTNTTSFTPSSDYHPATKKYVDDSIIAGGGYTDEKAQDAAGGMFSGNTETGITVTYNDTTGKVDFVVATQSDVNFTSALNTKLAGIATGAEVNVNADWNASSGDAQILNKPTIPTVSDTAYGSGWNGDTNAASKNAIYDKIETIAIGNLPTGTEGQTIQYNSSGQAVAVNNAPLAFTDNVSRNSSTGVVSVPVTATATSGSAVPLTSGGAYTALGGKQDTLVSGTNIKTINSTSILGSGNIDIAGGTGGYVTLSAVPYSDVDCTTGQYGYYGSTAYLCTGGFWTSKWTLTTHSNPTPTPHSLTITPSGFTGTDKFTYNSIDYTTEQTITGLSADASFTVTPDTGRAITCTGTGLTDNTGGSYTANTDTANVATTCTSTTAATSEILSLASTGSAHLEGWSLYSGTNNQANSVIALNDTDSATYKYKATGTAATEYHVVNDTTLTCTGGTVAIYVVAKSSVAGDTLRLLLHDGSYRNAPDVTLTDSYATYSYTWTSNPANSSAWTQSAVNLYSAGMRDNAAHAGTIEVNKLWLVRTCP